MSKESSTVGNISCEVEFIDTSNCKSMGIIRFYGIKSKSSIVPLNFPIMFGMWNWDYCALF
jgi:hypothetical protein